MKIGKFHIYFDDLFPISFSGILNIRENFRRYGLRFTLEAASPIFSLIVNWKSRVQL